MTFGNLGTYSGTPDYNSMLEAGHLQNLGVEPLSDDFEEAEFVEEMSKRTGVLKKVLLDQKVVAGLGNIYADEACFLSGIKPQTKVSKLSKNKLHKLYRVIKYVIPRAVELGGSSVANYLLADGSRGNYAREHWVYQRGGKPCKLCGTILKSQQLAGRTTVWCPHDQR
jgi:formamidopyrimidine-DNA glycosylase